jgi:hypothetical protein
MSKIVLEENQLIQLVKMCLQGDFIKDSRLDLVGIVQWAKAQHSIDDDADLTYAIERLAKIMGNDDHHNEILHLMNIIEAYEKEHNILGDPPPNYPDIDKHVDDAFGDII